MDFENIIIVTGHYGSGKTNLSINLALELKSRGRDVTLADLDVVNPYFRTADFKGIAEQHGISLLASDYANSNLDIPALSGGLDAKLNADGTLIIDVGGDDAGAFALGRYSPAISKKPYTMLYVVNAYRYLTREPEEAAELLYQIEAASRLTVTHIANCSNLGRETTALDVLKAVPYAKRVAGITNRPIAFTAAQQQLENELNALEDFFPVQIFVKTPWN